MIKFNHGIMLSTEVTTYYQRDQLPQNPILLYENLSLCYSRIVTLNMKAAMPAVPWVFKHHSITIRPDTRCSLNRGPGWVADVITGRQLRPYFLQS